MQKTARVIISGATGFIGKALCSSLVEKGYEVVALSRNVEKGRAILGSKVIAAGWDGRSGKEWSDYANGAQAIVNLAGENLAEGRWNERKKQAILRSRLDAGVAVVEAVRTARQRPKVIVQASAVGYYGTGGDDLIDESSSPGQGFLAEVAKKWELSTQDVESLGMRRAIIRSGVVLGKEEGALARLAAPFRFFIGGPLGSGKQWLSWVHLKDEAAAIIFLIEREGLSGVFNLAAPNPVRQKDFARILGKVLRRPSLIPVPASVLRLFLGEVAREMLLVSQRVVPRRLTAAGYRFIYPELRPALEEIL